MEKKKQTSSNSMKRTLIIVAVAFVVIAALLLILWLMPDKDGADTSESPTESLEPIETHYLINDQFSKLDWYELYDADGKLVHKITAKAGATDLDIIYSIEPSVKGWDYSDESFRQTAINAATLSALSLVDENPTDLSKYGLDKPSGKMKFSFGGGNRKYELSVGGMTALNNSYYVLGTDGKVYAVGQYAVDILRRSEIMYRTYEFFPDYYNTETYEYETNGEISYVRLYDPATDFDLVLRAVEDGEFENAMTSLYIDKPYPCFANDDQAEKYVINGAVAVQVDGIYLDDPTEQQLADTSLDKPKELWMKNIDGDEVHYYIGNIIGTNAYVMVEGVNSILTASNVYSALWETDYADIMFKMLANDSVRDVKEVRYNTVNGDHRLELSYEASAEENAAGTLSGTLDGNPISSTNAARLYSRTLEIQIYEAYDKSSVKLPASPALRMEIERNDGVVTTLELYMINERRYAVKSNGEEMGFYVHRDAVNSLLDGFDIIAAGDTLPRS